MGSCRRQVGCPRMKSLAQTEAAPASICPLGAEPSCDIRCWARGPWHVGTPPLHGAIEAIEVEVLGWDATLLWGFRSDVWGSDGGPEAEVLRMLGEYSRGLGLGQAPLQGGASR